MTRDDTQPDHSDPGEGRDVGAGYPEEEPDGANPGPEKSGSGDGGKDAPRSKGGQDSDPGAATGNPGAAGG
jgi:hypothetical protein